MTPEEEVAWIISYIDASGDYFYSCFEGVGADNSAKEIMSLSAKKRPKALLDLVYDKFFVKGVRNWQSQYRGDVAQVLRMLRKLND